MRTLLCQGRLQVEVPTPRQNLPPQGQRLWWPGWVAGGDVAGCGAAGGGVAGHGVAGHGGWGPGVGVQAAVTIPSVRAWSVLESAQPS